MEGSLAVVVPAPRTTRLETPGRSSRQRGEAATHTAADVGEERPAAAVRPGAEELTVHG
jgi:hypothetical protein